MPRLLVAACLTALLFAPQALAQSGSAKAHLAAGKKAERSKNFTKMLEEYQAACAADPGNECQLGIADAYAKLGDKEKARAAYDTLINDPFAQGKYIARAKGALAKLDSAGPPPLDLPAGPPALEAPPMDLSGPPAVAEPGRKGKRKKGKRGAQADAPPPGLDLPPVGYLPALPSDPPSSSSSKKDKLVARADAPPLLDLPPGLDAPPADTGTSAGKKKGKKGKKDQVVAKAGPPALDAPPTLDGPPSLDGPPPALDGPPSLDGPPAVASTEPPAAPAATEPPAVASTEPPVVIASNDTGSKTSSAPSTATPNSGRTVSKDALVAPVPLAETSARSSGRGPARTMAYVATGLAVVALGGGAFMYSKSSSSASSVETGLHSRTENQKLLDDQKSQKTLSAVGLIAGVALGGAAAILFTF